MTRVTLVDVARAAGVSTATVDRVLNNRGGVKSRTCSQVLATAVRLGYLEDSASGVPAGVPITLDFVLPGGTNRFIEGLANQLERQSSLSEGVTVRLHFLKGFTPDELALSLSGLRGHSQGIGIIGVDHPTVREEIQNLSNDGIPMLTLVSDISHVPRIGYVGVDNREAGRLAGYLLGRFIGARPGAVALFTGALAYRGHEEREMGFRAVLREHFPGLSIVVHREIHDDPDRAYNETRSILEEYPDLLGLYNIGSGNRGIGRALLEMKCAQKVTFVGHDVTEHTRELLLNGTMDAALDQNPAKEARLAIHCLAAAIRGTPIPVCPLLRTHIICRENLPSAIIG